MILTDQDKALFKSLEGSNTGKHLKDYLQRLAKDICDIRNWKEYTEENAKAMTTASSVIENDIIGLIREKARPSKRIEPFK